MNILFFVVVHETSQLTKSGAAIQSKADINILCSVVKLNI